MESARIRIAVSWLFAIAGGVIGFAAGPDAADHRLLTGVVGVYLGWALYWGVPPVWVAWCNFVRREGVWDFRGEFVISLVFFFYVPLVGGYIYGVFGGALYEFLKHLRLAKGMSPTPFAPRRREPSLEEIVGGQEMMRSLGPDADVQPAGYDADVQAEPASAVPLVPSDGICRGCGVQLRQSARFCAHCGAASDSLPHG